MWEKTKFYRFCSRIYGLLKRKLNPRRRPRQPVAIDEYEYQESTFKFYCTFCFQYIEPQGGIILKKCKHKICKQCLVSVIEHSNEVEISCPYFDCPGIITDREIRCFISYENYQRLLDRSLAAAEASNRQSFHCRTPNCVGWVEIGNERVKNFKCQVCRRINCIKCKTIHERTKCEQYQKKLRILESELSEETIERGLKEKKFKRCPTCNVIIEKHGGCSRMQCSLCKKEFSWEGLWDF